MRWNLKRIFLWVLFVFYNGLLIRASLLPYKDLPPSLRDVNEFFLHSFNYFLFFIFARTVFEYGGVKKIQPHSFLLAALWCFVTGLLLEWGQTFVPGRSASWDDAVANVAGISLGAGFYYFRRRGKNK
ncbi:MAG: VanZ family protein [Candidatus Omnitrophica bacterium]|nr:VanZ family protein [Candidatus Omnitrophota bacterium]